MQFLLIALSLSIIGYWFYLFWGTYRLFRITRKFQVKDLSQHLPRISVVVPARNEGPNIRHCLDSLQRQTYRNLEVILVNDRSDDDTGAIMQEFVKSNSHWKYIQVDQLPKGWLGKNHALHTGAQGAIGDYIIFTDGDVVFRPLAIEKAVQSVVAHKLDHFCMSPNLRSGGLLLDIMQDLFGLGMIQFLRLHHIGESPNYYVGIGAFNLVRTKLYRFIGGHESIKLEVLDDVMLGKIMVQNGAKPGLRDGKDLFSIQWYPNWKAMVLGLEKNSFAASKYSIFRLFIFLTSLFGIFLFPYIGVFIEGGPIQFLFGLSIIIGHITLLGIALRMKHSPWTTLLLPIGVIMIGFTFVRAAILTKMRGYVRWRDTTYSLDELQKATKF